MIKHINPIPSTHKKWAKEIAEAYLDAKETIMFALVTGQKMTEKDLYHLAPAVCLKFRGIKTTDKILKTVTQVALSNYIANIEINKEPLSDPYIAFTFCYLASHFGLDIIDEQQFESIMEYLKQKE